MPRHTGLGSVSVRTREDRGDAAPKDVLCSPRGSCSVPGEGIVKTTGDGTQTAQGFVL
jgi:hypothetical protein